MKILFDLSFINSHNICKGIPVHALRLLKNIQPNRRAYIVLLVSRNMRGYFSETFPDYRLITLFSTNALLWHLWLFRRYYRYVVEHSGCDAMIVSDELRRGNEVKMRIRKFVFIHDLKALKQTNVGASTIRYRHAYYANLIDNAEKVFPISKYTQQDILNYYPQTPPEKLQVIYNGVEVESYGVCPNISLNGDEYVLYVNTLSEYKNIMTALRAFAVLHRENPKLRMVIVGSITDHWTNECLPYINSCGINDRIVRLENLDSKHLRYLYEHARIFVNPSLREGFGLTPIEAAICRCPVVTSRCEALAETTRDLLFYYDPPTDVNALVAVMRSLLEHKVDAKYLDDVANEMKHVYDPRLQAELTLGEIDKAK